MGKQEDIFVNGEGDAWFERNVYKMAENPIDDPIIKMLWMENRLNLNEDQNILEFGCSNGWRLAALQNMTRRGNYFGIDPSLAAIANGRAKFKGLYLDHGTMTAHNMSTGSIDIVIYGFCLYVCDPEELFEIATQGDNVLKDGGHIVIYDFDADHPHGVPNHHVPGLMTYKMDWSQLWLASPAYSLVAKNVLPDETAVWLLKKDQKKAFPC